ncbi:hypothetical protein J2853_004391 [Streptosporangium lutulentum]|uniref:Uncharacterized protein n=1 Tax=Streptosporangium lutulentum TaxID=1461250 RepID=A0ABT9QFN6_9ACTN|nr:hypothetical protein [Streptosporangium lutulentum]
MTAGAPSMRKRCGVSGRRRVLGSSSDQVVPSAVPSIETSAGALNSRLVVSISASLMIPAPARRITSQSLPPSRRRAVSQPSAWCRARPGAMTLLGEE